MSKQSFGNLLKRESLRVLGKKIGSRYLRIMHANKPEVLAARNLLESEAKKSLHSQAEHARYAKERS